MFTKVIRCWFTLHNENHCVYYIVRLTWLSMKRKCCIISGHSSMAAFIPLSLFEVVVNNDQNTYGLLSSFPLSVSESLTRLLYLMMMMIVRLVFPFVCLLTQINALISLDPGVRLCKLPFIKHIDSRAGGIKNTWSNWKIHIHISNEIHLYEFICLRLQG